MSKNERKNELKKGIKNRPISLNSIRLDSIRLSLSLSLLVEINGKNVSFEGMRKSGLNSLLLKIEIKLSRTHKTGSFKNRYFRRYGNAHSARCVTYTHTHQIKQYQNRIRYLSIAMSGKVTTD